MFFIVWSGFGFIAILIAVVGAVVGGLVLQPAIASIAPALPANLGIAIGLGSAAAANWFAGLRLNSRPGRELIDPKTSQRVVIRRRHTLFWIPVQYMSALMVIAAVFLLFAPPMDNSNAAQPRDGDAGSLKDTKTF